MPKLSYILEPILTIISTEDEDLRKLAVKTNNLLLQIMDKVKNTTVEFINIMPTV
jgi:vacuole morphology and inheritance protein 14